MSWEQKARLHREAGVAAPSSPPSEFTLSPRAPYRVPGGYLTMYRFSIAGTAGSVPPTWRPDLPSPTGSAEIGSHNETRIHLARVRPNTQYLLDLSVDPMMTLLKVEVSELGPVR